MAQRGTWKPIGWPNPFLVTKSLLRLLITPQWFLVWEHGKKLLANLNSTVEHIRITYKVHDVCAKWLDVVVITPRGKSSPGFALNPKTLKPHTHLYL